MNKRGLGGLGRGGGMMGKGNMTARFDKKEEEDVGVFLPSWYGRTSMKISDLHLSYQGSAAPAPPATEEEARLAAFFNETSNEWEQTHEALSQLVLAFLHLIPLFLLRTILYRSGLLRDGDVFIVIQSRWDGSTSVLVPRWA